MQDFFTIHLDKQIAAGSAFRRNKPFVEKEKIRRIHNHDFYECFWIETGRCTHFINGREENLEQNSLVFIRPDDRHAFRNRGSEACLMVNVAFSVETADHLYERYQSDLQDRTSGRKAKCPNGTFCLWHSHAI